MERKPHSTGSIVGAVLLLVVVLLCLYVGGYFVLGKYGDFFREYPYDWLAYGYRPVARVEGAVIGNHISLFGPTIIYFPDGEIVKRVNLNP